MEKFTVNFVNGREPVVIEGESFADAISKSANKDWSYADFFGKDFTYADCRWADFTRALCSEANFTGAHCYCANFTDAICRDANFTSADCSRANFTGAICRYTNFTDAICRWANFTGADIDFSCWPLRCGSLNVKIDKRLFVQLLYHAVRAGQSVEDDEVQSILGNAQVIQLCNQFHRVDECGKIESK